MCFSYGRCYRLFNLLVTGLSCFCVLTNMYVTLFSQWHLGVNGLIYLICQDIDVWSCSLWMCMVRLFFIQVSCCLLCNSHTWHFSLLQPVETSTCFPFQLNPLRLSLLYCIHWSVLWQGPSECQNLLLSITIKQVLDREAKEKELAADM